MKGPKSFLYRLPRLFPLLLVGLMGCGQELPDIANMGPAQLGGLSMSDFAAKSNADKAALRERWNGENGLLQKASTNIDDYYAGKDCEKISNAEAKAACIEMAALQSPFNFNFKTLGALDNIPPRCAGANWDSQKEAKLAELKETPANKTVTNLFDNKVDSKMATMEAADKDFEFFSEGENRDAYEEMKSAEGFVKSHDKKAKAKDSLVQQKASEMAALGDVTPSAFIENNTGKFSSYLELETRVAELSAAKTEYNKDVHADIDEQITSFEAQMTDAMAGVDADQFKANLPKVRNKIKYDQLMDMKKGYEEKRDHHKTQISDKLAAVKPKVKAIGAAFDKNKSGFDRGLSSVLNADLVKVSEPFTMEDLSSSVGRYGAAMSSAEAAKNEAKSNYDTAMDKQEKYAQKLDNDAQSVIDDKCANPNPKDILGKYYGQEEFNCDSSNKTQAANNQKKYNQIRHDINNNKRLMYMLMRVAAIEEIKQHKKALEDIPVEVARKAYVDAARKDNNALILPPGTKSALKKVKEKYQKLEYIKDQLNGLVGTDKKGDDGRQILDGTILHYNHDKFGSMQKRAMLAIEEYQKIDIDGDMKGLEKNGFKLEDRQKDILKYGGDLDNTKAFITNLKQFDPTKDESRAEILKQMHQIQDKISAIEDKQQGEMQAIMTQMICGQDNRLPQVNKVHPKPDQSCRNEQATSDDFVNFLRGEEAEAEGGKAPLLERVEEVTGFSFNPQQSFDFVKGTMVDFDSTAVDDEDNKNAHSRFGKYQHMYQGMQDLYKDSEKKDLFNKFNKQQKDALAFFGDYKELHNLHAAEDGLKGRFLTPIGKLGSDMKLGPQYQGEHGFGVFGQWMKDVCGGQTCSMDSVFNSAYIVGGGDQLAQQMLKMAGIPSKYYMKDGKIQFGEVLMQVLQDRMASLEGLEAMVTKAGAEGGCSNEDFDEDEHGQIKKSLGDKGDDPLSSNRGRIKEYQDAIEKHNESGGKAE